MAAPHLNPKHKGAFHRWLGKKEGEPITEADIQRGLKAGGHAAQMANFAKQARGWDHGKKKAERKEGREGRMYKGKKTKFKRNGKDVEE